MKCDVKRVKLLDNSSYMLAFRLIMNRPSLETIEFDKCNYFSVRHLLIWMQKHSKIRCFILNRCEGLSKKDSAFLLENNALRFTVNVNESSTTFHFNGCWTIFDEPADYFQPEDVVETVMSALNAGTLGFHIAKRFYLNNELLCLQLDTSEFFYTYNKINEWKSLKARVVGEKYAVVVMITALSSPFVWILEKENGLWKIKRVGEISVEKAWHMMSSEFYMCYNSIDCCRKRMF